MNVTVEVVTAVLAGRRVGECDGLCMMLVAVLVTTVVVVVAVAAVECSSCGGIDTTTDMYSLKIVYDEI